MKKTLKKILKVFLIALLVVIAFIAMIATYFVVTVTKQYEGVIENYKPFTPSYVYDMEGTQIDVISALNNDPVTIDEIPLLIRNAFISVEDKRFYSHHGIDYLRLSKAIMLNLTGTGREGGSTITQQLIKNLFLTSSRSIIKRKIPEAILAIQMERKYTKDEILTMYLNSINFGRGAYGIKNAALVYFNKSLDQITPAEASILASIPKSPTKYSKLENSLERHNIVLMLMYNNGAITREEYENALKEEIKFYSPNQDGDTIQNISTTNIAPEFSSSVIKEVMRILGIEEGEEEKLFNGYKIYATIDLNIQKAAYKAFLGNKTLQNIDNLEGALISIDPSNGFVKAMVGGKKYIKGNFNRALNALRQPGSSFKPFVYLTAIQNDYPINTVVEDAEYRNKNWRPKNYDFRHRGGLTYMRALEISNNIAAIKVLEEVGIKDVVNNWLKTGAPNKNIPNDLTLALGSMTINPINLATAYASFANGGYKVTPQFVYKIENQYGEVIYEAKPKGERIFEEEDISIMVQTMQSIINNGTATSAKVYKNGKLIDMAGKTGTTNDVISVWFAGFTPTLSTVVYVGYDDNKPIKNGNLSIPLWRDFMQNVVNIPNYQVGTFDFITKQVSNGKLVSRYIDAYNGLLATDEENTREALFKKGTEPVEKEDRLNQIFSYGE